MGAAIQLFSVPPGPCLNAITSAFAYTAAVVAVAIGVTLRGPRPLGTRFGIGAGLLIMAGVWFFCTVHDSLLARIYLMNYGYAAILLVAAIRIAPLRHGRREEKALFWSLLVFSLHFFPRVAFTVGLDAEYTSNYDSTVFWVALTLSVTLLGTALIGAVLALAVSDVLDTLRRERDTVTLTGLLNRHGFTTAAGAKLARTETAGLTMVVCDIDRFKSANDAYGHNAGDEVLATVGTLILDNLRPGSVAGRLGGDEFVVLLAGTASDATEFADVVGH